MSFDFLLQMESFITKERIVYMAMASAACSLLMLLFLIALIVTVWRMRRKLEAILGSITPTGFILHEDHDTPADKDRVQSGVELRGEVIALVQKNHNGVPIIAENNQSKLSSFKSSPKRSPRNSPGGDHVNQPRFGGRIETETPGDEEHTYAACLSSAEREGHYIEPETTPKNTWRGPRPVEEPTYDYSSLDSRVVANPEATRRAPYGWEPLTIDSSVPAEGDYLELMGEADGEQSKPTSPTPDVYLECVRHDELTNTYETLDCQSSQAQAQTSRLSSPVPNESGKTLSGLESATEVPDRSPSPLIFQNENALPEPQAPPPVATVSKGIEASADNVSGAIYVNATAANEKEHKAPHIYQNQSVMSGEPGASFYEDMSESKEALYEELLSGAK